MAVQGNDLAHLKKQIAATKARKDAVSGGWRFTLQGVPIVIQPGLLTYAQRREIRSTTGEAPEHWGSELGTSIGADTMAAIVWIGLYQQHGDDAPTIEDVLELVQGLDSGDIGEIELLGADGEPLTDEELEERLAGQDDDPPAKNGRRGEVMDLSDPLSPGPVSTKSGPLSLPDMESAPTTSKT